MSGPKQRSLSSYFSKASSSSSTGGSTSSSSTRADTSKELRARQKQQALERSRKYEENRKPRTFRPEWGKTYPWIQHDEEKQVLFCKICRKHKAHLVTQMKGFVKGSTNFQASALKRHETENVDHKDAVRIEEAQIKMREKPGSLPAEKMLTRLNEKTLKQLENLFRTAHALAKKGRPFTDLVWQCDLDEVKGVDVGTNYRNDHQAKTFTEFIAAAVRKNDMKEVRKASFISLISDGTTDVSVTEDEIVYVQFATAGKVKVTLLGVESVELADANGILEAIKTVMTTYTEMSEQQWVQKLVGFGSDGASVMTGRENGVTAKLKEARPELQAVHCFAHRLELAYKDTVKNETLHKKLETLLTGLYTFYHKKALNRSMLKRAFKSINEAPRFPTRISGVQWVAHMHHAMGNLRKCYKAVVVHMEQVR